MTSIPIQLDTRGASLPEPQASRPSPEGKSFAEVLDRSIGDPGPKAPDRAPRAEVAEAPSPGRAKGEKPGRTAEPEEAKKGKQPTDQAARAGKPEELAAKAGEAAPHERVAKAGPGEQAAPRTSATAAKKRGESAREEIAGERPAAPREKAAVKLAGAKKVVGGSEEAAKKAVPPSEQASKVEEEKRKRLASRERDGALAAAALAALPETPGPAKGPKEAENGARHGAPPVVGAKNAPAPVQVVVVDLRSAASHLPARESRETREVKPLDTKSAPQAIRLVHLDLAGRGSPLTPAAPSRAPGPSAGLQQSWTALSDQIVKNAGVVLRDGDAGEIRLVLKPESLGSVRIRLDLKDNLVSGKIFVENDSVRQLFQQNLDGLYQALRDGGFQTASLNVSVGGRDGGERGRGRHSPLPGALSGTASLASHVPDLDPGGSGYSLVNLVV